MKLAMKMSIRLNPSPGEYATCAMLVLRSGWAMWKRLTLAKNMAKGNDWRISREDYFLALDHERKALTGRIMGELGELYESLEFGGYEQILGEAADVMNLVAMLADRRR